MALRPGQGLSIPAGQQAKLVEMHVVLLDLRGLAGVGLEKAIQAARNLEGLPRAACDDGEVVGGIAELSPFPIDESQRLPRMEEDVLPEQIAMQENGWLVGREMLQSPRVDFASERLIKVSEDGELCEGMISPRPGSRQLQASVTLCREALDIEGVHRGCHFSDHFPRADRRLPAGAEVERDAGHEGLDESRPAGVRKEAKEPGRPERQLDRGQPVQQPGLEPGPCVEFWLGVPKRQQNHIVTAQAMAIGIDIGRGGERLATQSIRQIRDPADVRAP